LKQLGIGGWHKRADYRAFTRPRTGVVVRTNAKSRATLPRVFHRTDQQRPYATGLYERYRRFADWCGAKGLHELAQVQPSMSPLSCTTCKKSFRRLRQAAPGRDPHALRLASDGIAEDVDGYLFRSAHRKTGQLTTNPLFQQDAHRIIRRRAKSAGIETRIGNHTFRATGITAYLKNSGKLEVA
jgi:hypothetical protein